MGRFVELERFTESELTFLQANSEAVEDWIAELPAAEALRERSRQVQRANCEIAQRLLDGSAELNRVTDAVSASRFSVDLVRDKVKTLQSQTAALRTQACDAPGKAVATLERRAADADNAAEALLQDAVDGTPAVPATMSAEALTEFRQRYLQQKMEKHKRLGV